MAADGRLSKGVLQVLDQGAITGGDVINSMIAISRVAEETMGGTSGALYSWVSRRRSSTLQLKILSQDLFLLARPSTGTFLWHSSDDRGLE